MNEVGVGGQKGCEARGFLLMRLMRRTTEPAEQTERERERERDGGEGRQRQREIDRKRGREREREREREGEREQWHVKCVKASSPPIRVGPASSFSAAVVGMEYD